MTTKMLSFILTLSMVLSLSVPAFAAENSTITLKQSYDTSVTIPERFLNLDLSQTGYDRNKMSEEEAAFFDYLLNEAVDNHYNTGNKEQFKNDVEAMLKSSYSSSRSASKYTLNSDAPWWHLNTVEKVGAAIDIVIGGGLSKLGATSIRALIKQVGEAEAKKLVKSVIISKVKSTLLRWGMVQGATWVEAYGVKFIFAAIDFSPGLIIAKGIDSIDARPNNGYIEFW
ncbi:hypothetical protein [Clostridium minihomine]|uniref:hypothetical protein n=1 Tax=Clostridium minihomine TaxID=2045012 RepID=UPI000C777604|nr:hypothetical protein [Clostridium minihomine]